MLNNETKELALSLFMQGFTQKEIAQKLGKSENTIGKWSEDGDCKNKRTNIPVFRETLISELYDELTEMNKAIRSRTENKFATHKEALVRRMLVNDIVDLEALKSGINPAYIQQLREEKRKELAPEILKNQSSTN